MAYSPPGSSVHGVLQVRILEWVAIPFSGDLPNSGIELGSPALQVDIFFLPSEPLGKPMNLTNLRSTCKGRPESRAFYAFLLKDTFSFSLVSRFSGERSGESKKFALNLNL